MGIALLHRVLAVDAVRESLVCIAQADVLALADLERVGEVFVVVAAGQEVVNFDAHVWCCFLVTVVWLLMGMMRLESFVWADESWLLLCSGCVCFADDCAVW